MLRVSAMQEGWPASGMNTTDSTDPDTTTLDWIHKVTCISLNYIFETEDN